MDNGTINGDNGKADNVGSEQPKLGGGVNITDSGNPAGNSGYIDPQLARDTAGPGGVASPGGSSAPGSSDAPKRGRGRPPGSGAKSAAGDTPKATQASSVNLNGIEKILFSVHAISAAFLQVPELNLDQSEAKKLASAIEAVNAQYKLELDPKKAAWLELGTVASIIYGPRIMSIYIRKSNQKPMSFVRSANATPQPGDSINTPKTSAEKPSFINGFDPTKQTILN